MSFPEIYSDIERPPEIDVTAQNEKGETIRFYCGGLLARAIQHEYDHLQGILFIDRMTRDAKDEHKEEIDAIAAATKEQLKKKRDRQ